MEERCERKLIYIVRFLCSSDIKWVTWEKKMDNSFGTGGGVGWMVVEKQNRKKSEQCTCLLKHSSAKTHTHILTVCLSLQLMQEVKKRPNSLPSQVQALCRKEKVRKVVIYAIYQRRRNKDKAIYHWVYDPNKEELCG